MDNIMVIIAQKDLFIGKDINNLQVLSIKRKISADECKKNDTEAPDVHFGAVVLLACVQIQCISRRLENGVAAKSSLKVKTALKLLYTLHCGMR